MKRLVVTAPYVTMKVRDPRTGGLALNEFYQGAVVPDGADPDDVKRLEGKGMLGAQDEILPQGVVTDPDGTRLAEEREKEAQAAQDLAAADPDGADDLAHDDSDEAEVDDGLEAQRPGDSASKPAWVDYAVAVRDPEVSAADARAEAEAMTKADLIKTFG